MTASTASAPPARPRVGVFSLTGCGGDGLTLRDCQAQLADSIHWVDDDGARLDLALVEGAVLSQRDEDRLKAIRARSDRLLALGTCAMHGGIPDRPLHDVVLVDMSLPGCPVEKKELLEALACIANGDPPQPRAYPVCTECRLLEKPCLLSEPAGFCLGFVTAAGCDARCPALGIGCVGCRGPAVDANWPSAMQLFLDRGLEHHDLVRKMRTFARAPVGMNGPRGLELRP